MTEFVLAHGTTQSPASRDRLAGEVRGRGHDVTAIDLPTGKPERTPADYAHHGHELFQQARGSPGDP